MVNEAADSKASATKRFLFSLGSAHSEQAGQTQSTSLREENHATSPIPFSLLAWILVPPPNTLNAGILNEGLVLLSLCFNPFPQAVSVTFIILTTKQMLPDVFELQTHSSNGSSKAETKGIQVRKTNQKTKNSSYNEFIAVLSPTPGRWPSWGLNYHLISPELTPAINYTIAETTFYNLLSPLKSKYHFPDLEKNKQG